MKIKLRMFRTEPVAALLYGCETLALKVENYTFLRRLYHRGLLRIIGFVKQRAEDHTLSYTECLKTTRCVHIESIVRARRLLWAGKNSRMADERLPKIMLFGEMNDGVGKRGRPEKSWRQLLTEAIGCEEQ